MKTQKSYKGGKYRSQIKRLQRERIAAQCKSHQSAAHYQRTMDAYIRLNKEWVLLSDQLIQRERKHETVKFVFLIVGIIAIIVLLFSIITH